MNQTTPNSVDIQNIVDNFSAVVASGDLKLIAQDGEVKLYQDENGFEYVYDGSHAYSEQSEEFSQIKSQHFR